MNLFGKRNFVERAVILTRGECLEVPLEELPSPRPDRDSPQTSKTLNLRGVERETILEALRKTHGRVGGPGGAAALVGLKRSTLQARTRVLNIRASRSSKLS
jgi:formate hydrogenlyase transcriptional activator